MSKTNQTEKSACGNIQLGNLLLYLHLTKRWIESFVTPLIGLIWHCTEMFSVSCVAIFFRRRSVPFVSFLPVTYFQLLREAEMLACERKNDFAKQYGYFSKDLGVELRSTLAGPQMSIQKRHSHSYVHCGRVVTLCYCGRQNLKQQPTCLRTDDWIKTAMVHVYHLVLVGKAERKHTICCLRGRI